MKTVLSIYLSIDLHIYLSIYLGVHTCLYIYHMYYKMYVFFIFLVCQIAPPSCSCVGSGWNHPSTLATCGGKKQQGWQERWVILQLVGSRSCPAIRESNQHLATTAIIRPRTNLQGFVLCPEMLETRCVWRKDWMTRTWGQCLLLPGIPQEESDFSIRHLSHPVSLTDACSSHYF